MYGTLGAEEPEWTEASPLAPRSPYAAAKAAGELLARSYFVTYGLDVVITRGSNTYGPYQHPEKLIPLFISNALDDQPLPLYGDGMQRRDWLHVSDHAGAVEHVLRHGRAGEAYNVPGSAELAEPRGRRGAARGTSASRGRSCGASRTGPATTAGTRWTAPSSGRSAGTTACRSRRGCRRPIDWFAANEEWWRAVRSGEWDAYYERQYGRRLATCRGRGRALTAATDADARRGHRRERAARPGTDRGAGGGAVHRAGGPDRVGSRPPSTWTTPAAIHDLLPRDRPEVVINAAAWTDVDGCARDPDAGAPAERRRGARPRRGDGGGGRRPDPDQHERGLRRPPDRRPRLRARTTGPAPINAYGESKLDGEIVAGAAYRGRRAQLAIVRTSWLFGPPGNDFPQKILAAADRARAAGEPLKVVGDEIGGPTLTSDLAEAIVGAAVGRHVRGHRTTS